MKTSRNLLHSLISLTLLLGVATSPALGIQSTESVSGQAAQFGDIEQPLFRIGLTIGGFGLLGILVWSAIESGQGESVAPHQGASVQNR